MTVSTGQDEAIDYESVCVQLLQENEQLRIYQYKMFHSRSLPEKWKDLKEKVLDGCQRHPYVSVVGVYAVLSLLEVLIRRVTRER
jgi:hypothetical protein